MEIEKPEAEAGSISAPPPRPKTSFGGDVLKLVSGTTVAQLLGILATPILTRLYAPEAFGLLALFTSITSILGVIACLRYELAIMLPESDEEAANLLGVSLLFTILISLLTIPVVWWGGDLLLGWLNAPELSPYLWLIPPTVFVIGTFLALNYWNSRTKHFGRLSVARVSQSLTTVSAQLGFGFAGFATGGTLISASVGGQALAVAVLGSQIWHNDRMLFLRSISRQEMFLGFRRYRKFPLLDMWSALLNNISLQLPTLILAAFFSSTIVGFYALGFRLLNIPMSLIGGAIAQVFYQRVSVAVAEKKIVEVVKTTFQRLSMLGAFPFVLLAIISPELFAAVFGDQWIEAGIYVQILAPWLFFVFIASPVSALNSALELQEAGLFFNFVLIASRMTSLIIGGIADNVMLALLLFSSSGCILWIWFSIYLISKSGLKILVIVRIVLQQVLKSTLFVLPVILFKWLFVTTPVIVLVTAGLSTLSYYFYVIASDKQLRINITNFISKRVWLNNYD